MQCIIDRFEGDYAILEYQGKVYNFPKAFLPENAGEGDVLSISISVDREQTQKLRREICKLAGDVWET